MPAFAGWTVTNLQPAGATLSFANSSYGGSTVGQAYTQISRSEIPAHAGMWNGTADSWVDLNPAGAGYSRATGVSGNKQVGYATIGVHGLDHASLWSGTAESWVDLNPAGADQSGAYAAFDNKQAGYSTLHGSDHAGMWNGTADSWVDLQPGGVYQSNIYGMSDNTQVGCTSDYWLNYRASMWNGTANSWVDLHPAGANYSSATGVSGNKQVGSVWSSPGGDFEHASMWSGTAGSWVDLNPAGASSSSAKAISGDMIVGFANLQSVNRTHAYLWNIAGNSPIDLHTLLPQGVYEDSHATGVDVSGNDIWISGYASGYVTNYYGNIVYQPQAILWHYTAVPEPSSFIGFGTFLSAFLVYRRRR